MNTTTNPVSRQLDQRTIPGTSTTVELLWDELIGSTMIAVDDPSDPKRSFVAAVPNEKAMDAFWHPYVYQD